MRTAVVDALRPAGLWTCQKGLVHIRDAGTGFTFCGAEVGPYTSTTATSSCEECVTESIHDYARHHVCGPECHV